jgi:phosphatidylglycerol:prolipoprotein diacylglycerol transferase
MLAGIGVVIAFVFPMLVGSDGLPVSGYGVMLFVAGLGSWAVDDASAARGSGSRAVLSMAVWFLIFGLIGARLFYVIEYWSKFQRPTLAESLLAMVNVTQGGLVVYGSLLAGGVAMLLFVRRHRLPALAFADLIAPGVMLGVGLGRIGCFSMAAAAFATCPAVQFPQGSPLCRSNAA